MMKEACDHRLAKCLGVLLLFVAIGLAADGPLSFFKSEAQTKPSAPNYTQQISQNYDLKFGSNPFAPSNATSTTGTFIPGEMFVPSKRCGNCHTDAHAQWRQSAHGNAFREPFYQKTRSEDDRLMTAAFRPSLVIRSRPRPAAGSAVM